MNDPYGLRAAQHALRPPRFEGRALIPVVGVGAALIAAYLLLHGSTLVALGFCTVPLVVWLVGNPGPALILLGASIPITRSLTGGTAFNLAPSDLLLVLVGASILFQATVRGSLPALSALRPLFRTVVPYSFLLLALLAVHLSIKDFAQTGQRFELFGLSLLVGAFAALTGRHLALLKAYLLAATVLAAAWPVANSLGQKNPVGQMIANAILLLLGVRNLRHYAPLAFVLVPGLILTGSRGALVATAVGVLVILALQESRVQTIFARLSILALLAFASYALIPASLQARLTTFAPGVGSPGAYALHIRQQYAADAVKIIKAHPYVGIGVGNYVAGTSEGGTQAVDPHDVHSSSGGRGRLPVCRCFRDAGRWSCTRVAQDAPGGCGGRRGWNLRGHRRPRSDRCLLGTRYPSAQLAARRYGLRRPRQDAGAGARGDASVKRNVHVVIVALSHARTARPMSGPPWPDVSDNGR